MTLVNAAHSPYKLTACWEYDKSPRYDPVDLVVVPRLYREIDGVQKLLYDGPNFCHYTCDGVRTRYIINPFAADSIIIVHSTFEVDDEQQSLQKIKVYPDRASESCDIDFRVINIKRCYVEAAFLDERSFIYFVCTDKSVCHYVRDNQILKTTEVSWFPYNLVTLERDVFMDYGHEQVNIIRHGRFDPYSIDGGPQYRGQYHFIKLLWLLYPLTDGIFNEVLTILVQYCTEQHCELFENDTTINLYPE